MYNYEIDLCDEDGNTTHKGEYSIELDYQPDEIVSGHLFCEESATVSSITGPEGESVDEDDFRAMVAEMNDTEITDEKWQEFLLGLMNIEDPSSRVKHYSRWW